MTTTNPQMQPYNGAMANPNQPHGEVWKAARKIFIEHPFVSPADIAKVLKVSKARIYQTVEDLWEERKKVQKQVLNKLKEEYKSSQSK
jgi:hypothetical protein